MGNQLSQPQHPEHLAELNDMTLKDMLGALCSGSVLSISHQASKVGVSQRYGRFYPHV